MGPKPRQPLSRGQQQEFDVHGYFGPGIHAVSVAFVNDKIGDFYPGTQLAVDTTDRNLYVMGMSLDGGTPATDTPRTADTATITSDNVTSSGSGGGVSFVAPLPTSTTASAPPTVTGLVVPASTVSMDNTTPDVATPTPQDFGVPTPATLAIREASGHSGGALPIGG